MCGLNYGRLEGMRRLAPIKLLLALALSSSVALADATPGEVFKKGRAEYNAGHFVAAAKLFERADAMAPTSQAAYNAGMAWDSAHQRAPAANALSRALDRGQLSAAEVEEASKRLAELAPSLGKLSLNEPEGAKVMLGDVESSIPGTLYVDPGTHQLRVSLPDGTLVERRVNVRAGQAVALSFQAAPAKARPPAPGKPSAPQRDTLTANPESSSAPVLGYSLLGAGALALGAAVYVNVRGASANSDFEDSGHTDADARQRAIDLRTAAMITYGAAAVLGGVGLTLVLTSADGKRAEAYVGPGSVGLSGRF